jgi:outer membrane protein assembly factor BamB
MDPRGAVPRAFWGRGNEEEMRHSFLMLFLFLWFNPLPGAHAQTRYQFTATFETQGSLPGAVKRLKRLAGQKAWDAWVTTYQGLIDEHPDAVLPQGEERLVGLRATLHQTLAGLPAAARQLYRRKFDPVARPLWEKARAEGDAEAMRRLYLQYRHTRYGPRALRWLADRALDMGEYEIARLAYERLAHEGSLQPGWAAENEMAWLLLRWGMAAALAGHPEESRTAFEQLGQKHGGRELKVGGVARRASQLALEERARLRPPAPPGPKEWPMFAGRPAGGRRMAGAVSDGGPTERLTRAWDADNPFPSPSADSGIDVHISPAPSQQMNLGFGGTSLFNSLGFPVVGDGRVYLQTAAGAIALDARDGKTLWTNNDLGHGAPRASQRRSFVYYRPLRNLQMAPVLAGPSLIMRVPIGQTDIWGDSPWPAEYAIVALDARTGREIWTRLAGGNPSGSFFNLPTVLGNTIYTGIASAVAGLTEYRATAIDAGTGERRWTAYLGTGSDPMTTNDGSPPAVADGVMWVESSLHTLNALDVVTGELLWIYRYQPRPIPYYRSRRRDRLTRPNEPISLIAPVGNRVLFAPRWGDQCVALDGRSGKLLWSTPRGETRTLFGVDERQAYLCGGEVQALDLATGTRRWRWAPPEGVPGYAALAGSRIYMPVGASVYVLDRDTGRQVATIDLRSRGVESDYAAVLLVGRRLLLSQPDQLYAFVEGR